MFGLGEMETELLGMPRKAVVELLWTFLRKSMKLTGFLAFLSSEGFILHQNSLIIQSPF
jgi:hypothetical protein